MGNGREESGFGLAEVYGRHSQRPQIERYDANNRLGLYMDSQSDRSIISSSVAKQQEKGLDLPKEDVIEAEFVKEEVVDLKRVSPLYQALEFAGKELPRALAQDMQRAFEEALK